MPFQPTIRQLYLSRNRTVFVLFHRCGSSMRRYKVLPTDIQSKRSNMRALVHRKADNSLSVQERPIPDTASENDQQLHLLRVHTTSFTNGELLWPDMNDLLEQSPGYDVAGTVILAPEGSKFKAGDSVYGYTSAERSGAAREFHVALEAELARKPEALSAEEAATVPLSALTAWQALFDHARLLPPQTTSTEGLNQAAPAKRPRVLVTAASGGVGVWAVQLASLAGAYVVATCGPHNLDFVRELGADEALDYSTTPVNVWTASDDSRAFDIVIDCKGGTTLEEAWTCVKAGGIINSIAQPPEDVRPAAGVAHAVESKWFIVRPSGDQLVEISKLLDSGACRTVVDSIYSFGDWKAAFERLGTGHARGKVVLRVGV